MSESHMRTMALHLYYQGVPTGVIANRLGIAESKIIAWLGL